MEDPAAGGGGEEGGQGASAEVKPEELTWLPPPGEGQVDLDFLFWVVEPSHLQAFSQLYTLANWHHPVNQFPNKGQLVVTELPLQIRLLSWAGKRLSLFGRPLAERKEMLQKELNKLWRKVSLSGRSGVLAMKKQTLSASTLAQAFQESGEHLCVCKYPCANICACARMRMVLFMCIYI